MWFTFVFLSVVVFWIIGTVSQMRRYRCRCEVCVYRSGARRRKW